jgi:hypothetical protein
MFSAFTAAGGDGQSAPAAAGDPAVEQCAG